MSNWQLSSSSLFLLFRELASRAFQLHKQVMLSACNSQSKANPCFTQKAKLVSECSRFFLLLDPRVQARCSTASRQEPVRASQHLGMSRGVDPRGWREEASTWKNKVQNKIEKSYLLVELSSGHHSHHLGTLWGGLKEAQRLLSGKGAAGGCREASLGCLHLHHLGRWHRFLLGNFFLEVAEIAPAGLCCSALPPGLAEGTSMTHSSFPVSLWHRRHYLPFLSPQEPAAHFLLPAPKLLKEFFQTTSCYRKALI